MLRVIDLRESDVDPRTVMPRAELDVDHAIELVRPTIEAVADRGYEAVLEACERFDGVRPEHLRVPISRIAAALTEA